MQSDNLLTPTLSFYRLNLLIGTFSTPVVLFLADYLNDDFPIYLHFFILFSIVSLIFYILTFISGFFIRKIRIAFILTGQVSLLFFLFIAYEHKFMYPTLVAQILILVSITFVLLNHRELTYFLGVYWFSDGIMLVVNRNSILFDRAYQLEFFHFHVLLSVTMGICYVAMVSRKSQAQKFEEILRSKELAMEFIEDSRRELDDMRFALNAASIVAITDKRGVITFANGNFERISGYTMEELLGNTHRIVNSGFHPPEFFREMWNTITAGEVWKGEIQNKRKDGSTYWVATTIVPLANNGNKPTRYLSIRNDITSRKYAEEKLKESESRFRNLYKVLKEDLQLASETQKYLMPRIERIPGIEWKSYVRPYMDVSGDIITMKRIDNKVDVLLADIAGHGVGAALISALVVFAFQQMDEQEKTIDGNFSPSRSLLHLRDGIQALQVDEFVCGVYFRLNLDTLDLDYSYAGQLPGFLYRDGITRTIDGMGMPLLPKGNLILSDYRVKVQSGDKILFFSDGAYEITNPREEILGYDRLKDIAHQHFMNENDVLEGVKSEILDYCIESPIDDISLFSLNIL